MNLSCFNNFYKLRLINTHNFHSFLLIFLRKPNHHIHTSNGRNIRWRQFPKPIILLIQRITPYLLQKWRLGFLAFWSWAHLIQNHDLLHDVNNWPFVVAAEFTTMHADLGFWSFLFYDSFLELEEVHAFSVEFV